MIAMPKTDVALLERLSSSASRPATKEEIAAQKVSFVFGNLPKDSTITEEQVERRIREKEGT